MNAFRILEDTQYKNQDRLFELIFNTEKKLDRLNNKVEVAELKSIKKLGCQNVEQFSRDLLFCRI